MLNRDPFLAGLAEQVLELRQDHPVRVAIDGRAAAGKSTLAAQLIARLRCTGREVIGATIDGFHHPSGRRNRQSSAAKGYYEDSFNYESLERALLEPLGPNGNRRFIDAVYDHRSECDVVRTPRLAPQDAILVFDGVMLLRPELDQHWDRVVLVDVTLETSRSRYITRESELGNTGDYVRRFDQRYAPGWEIYETNCQPHMRADSVIRNDGADQRR